MSGGSDPSGPRDLRSRAFDAHPSQMAVLDGDGTILETNRAWASFARDNGLATGADMVGTNYLAVCDEAASEDQTAARAAAGIRTVADGERDLFRLEYPCHGPEERRWFLMRAVPVADGDARHVLVVHTDITERRETELAVAEHNETLELLTSVLSHDLRNPMSVALGRAELLDGDEHVAQIVSALERMNAIIEDALVLASETAVDEPLPVDLAAVARTAWSHVATADATLTVEGTGTVPADEGLLSQALENLFRNAVENAGADAHVTVGVLEDGAGFFVADDGPGVPPDDREAVFDPGYSTNEADGGTGLGLAIVRCIAAGHGWDVRVTESDRGGARFEFTGIASKP